MLRTAALAALALLAAIALASWSVELAARGVVRVDDAVALGTAVGGTLVAAWYALTATALLLAELAELGRRAPRLARALRGAVGAAGAPVLRRAAVVGVGAGLALAALPASAGPAADDTVPHDLRPGVGTLSAPEPVASAPGSETAGETAPATDGPAAPSPPPAAPPAPPVDLSAPAAASPAPSASPPAAGQPLAPATAAVGDTGAAPARPAPAPRATSANRATYVVRAGDSLWSIAAAHLGQDATDRQIAAEWPRWYATNRAVIGADPDLIHPGQDLLAPEPKEQP